MCAEGSGSCWCRSQFELRITPHISAVELLSVLSVTAEVLKTVF